MNIKSKYNKPKKVAIIGANGYAGHELTRLILHHPKAQLVAIISQRPKWHISQEIHGDNLDAIPHLPVAALRDILGHIDTLFFATPNEVSMELTPMVFKSGVQIIDLSGAFRLPTDKYQHWYSQSHTASKFIECAQYGLSPWWNTGESQLIANPGCYATCAMMSLLPLLNANLIDPQDIIIDAKSGTSGAGKKPNETLLHAEIADNFYPYKIGKHQHLPEIQHYLDLYCQTKTRINLTTQLLPLQRGISMAIYLNPIINPDKITAAVLNAYEEAYKNYPLVKFHAINSDNPEACKFYLSLKYVLNSARVHIAFSMQQSRLVIYASLDNLMKGAASQAIENFNHTLGLLPQHSLVNDHSRL